MSCGVGCRRSSDPTLLWLWCRPAAIAPTGPLGWEPPFATGVDQEMAKRPKKKKKIQMNLFIKQTHRLENKGERWGIKKKNTDNKL